MASVLLASTALAGAPALAQTAPSAPPVKAAPLSALVAPVNIPYEKFTLPNGLTVITHTDRKAPIVAVSVWYDVGSKHEPTGKTGFAHLFEHLMFNGSENAPGDFFDPLRSIGATDLNGTTSYDRTNYFETVPKPALDRALFLESDRMGYLLGAVTQGVLDEQRGVVQNEKRQGDNQPYGLVRYKMTEGIFPQGHPYRHSVIGSMADLDAASLEDVKSWFRGHYGPNNAVLVLAGDIDAKEARPLVEKYFGAIPKGPESVLPTITVPTLAAPVREEMKDRVAATMIMKVWPVPGLNDPDSPALDVAMSAFGGLASSRLDNELVKREKLAVQVSAGVQSLSQAGMLIVRAVVRPGVDAKQVEARLDQMIADYLRTGPTADEVARVATTNVSQTIGGLESVGGFGGKAVALAQGELYSNDPGFYKKELNELATMTPARAKAAAQKWISRPAYTLVVVPGAREGYEEAKAAPKVADTSAPTPATAEGPAKGTRGAMPGVADIGGALQFPKVTRSRLSNGMELVYAQRTAVPITQVSMAFDAGIAADVAGKLGTAGMTLATLDEGTTTRNSIALAEAKERLGMSVGGGNSADQTTFGFDVPSANLTSATMLFADILKNPAFDPAEIERVRGQTLAQIGQQRTSPQGLADMTLPPLLYGADSPYAKLAAGVGDPAAVASLKREDLLAWRAAWLRPDKAKVFVVSDRPLAEVQAALNAGLGDWRATGTAGTKTFPAQRAAISPKIVLVDRPDSPQSLIVAAEMTPLNARTDTLAATTANTVLGSGFLSRINMDLREAKHWSYGARGGYQLMQNAVPYVINAPVQADKTGPAIASLREQISGFLGQNGVTPVEFRRSIDGETRQLAGTYETSGAVLGAMRSNDFLGRPDNYQATLPQKYRALTPQALDAAARASIDPNRFVYVVVGNAATVRPQLDALGLPVEVVQPAAATSATGGSK
ncbi:peptidase M16 [Sphingomonas sp. Leaf407]|uniref:M16 family metallopeptidase n=1 Tax=unclassified Sphingomonas TaxID=196159 RepID=UPI0006F5A34D|nr:MULTISPECIES: pitrilysin family protein [unclassified Sphingomonas]KQN40941.1 peptidase M16 [Sphingomonas sp. Leaf42]KQT29893.1 peptidase M16 [Sphingomonas sp. Leaf407]